MKTQRMFIYLTAVTVLSFALLSARTNSGENLDDVKKIILESNSLYFQAFAKNDVALFSDRYAEDCWIMLPNVPTMSGPGAPREFFEIGYQKFQVRGGKRITVDVYGVSDDIVAEVGFWKLVNAQNVEFEDGKFLVLWKKTPKGWKMWRDSFSSNNPRK